MHAGSAVTMEMCGFDWIMSKPRLSLQSNKEREETHHNSGQSSLMETVTVLSNKKNCHRTLNAGLRTSVTSTSCFISDAPPLFIAPALGPLFYLDDHRRKKEERNCLKVCRDEDGGTGGGE